MITRSNQTRTALPRPFGGVRPTRLVCSRPPVDFIAASCSCGGRSRPNPKLLFFAAARRPRGEARPPPRQEFHVRLFAQLLLQPPPDPPPHPKPPHLHPRQSHP